jgi:hypothetical protein
MTMITTVDNGKNEVNTSLLRRQGDEYELLTEREV